MAKKRNANGMGTWDFNAKKNLHIFRISYRDEAGGLHRKAFSGITQEIADKKYREWANIKNFQSTDPDITVDEWGDIWYEEYKSDIEDSTAGTYYYTLARIKKYFKGVRVVDVHASHIKKFLQNMAGAYDPTCCGQCRTMLGQIMRKAEAEALIKKSPVSLAGRVNYSRIRRLAGKSAKKKKDAFPVSEAHALLQGLPNTRIGHSIRVMLGAGISTQEILAVEAADIEPDGSLIAITKAVKLKKGGRMYIGDVKAEKRDRLQPIPPVVRASAIYLREHADGYIIAGRKFGMPIHPSTYRKFYEAAIRQVEGVHYLTPHCCRHTFISYLEDKKVDFAVIQALAGQSEKSSTIDYIHPLGPSVQNAVDLINDILSSPPVFAEPPGVAPEKEK